MADYNIALSQLHHRIWQEEFGLPAKIDEYGWIDFGSTPLGELTVVLREYNQEGMKLSCTIWADYSGRGPSHDLLLRICNSVNESEDAKLEVNDSGSVVRASLYLILAAKGKIPQEQLIRAIALPAITKIKDVKARFAEELKNAG